MGTNDEKRCRSARVRKVARHLPVDADWNKAPWRANFYKCADRTSHPHCLTWAPVDFPVPNFHLPRSFGVLEFEE